MSDKKRKVLKRIIVISSAIIVFILLLVTAFNAVYMSSKVNGYSMYPTLNKKMDGTKDKVFINRYEKGKRGDIVVANIKDEPNWDPSMDGDYIIKRLIGVEGDRIKMARDGDNYYVFVNGEVAYTKTYEGSVASFISFNKYVQANKENPDRISADGEIIVLEGEIFVAGDNYLGSFDSFRIGPLKKSSLVGRVDIIVKNGDNIVWGAIKGVFKMMF